MTKKDELERLILVENLSYSYIGKMYGVSVFDENTPIFEINSITNLIVLCPNHHWEYDNGILKI